MVRPLTETYEDRNDLEVMPVATRRGTRYRAKKPRVETARRETARPPVKAPKHQPRIPVPLTPPAERDDLWPSEDAAFTFDVPFEKTQMVCSIWRA